jgi:serine-type D-Ala-D-Ala carboxypeptidase/endopeptidase (penicillin-binding protein 4)
MKISNHQNKNKDTSIDFHSSILVSQTFHRHTCVDLQLSDCSVIKLFASAFNLIGIIGCAVFFLYSCSASRQISKQATQLLLKDSIISTGHTGISIYEPATNKYWYNYDATKYFVPASNVKLFSLYAGMKYLGDSLIGLRYQQKENELVIYPTGDPTFLHPDFKQQPVFDFLNKNNHTTYSSSHYKDALGFGWAWDDYMDTYMVQRSEFPIYGNLARVYNNKGILSVVPKNISLSNQKEFEKYGDSIEFTLSRRWDTNAIMAEMVSVHPVTNMYEMPLVTDVQKITEFLADTLHQKIHLTDDNAKDQVKKVDKKLAAIYSQPADSLFKPMMYNSDNFFAEQTLLMAANEHIGYMSDEAMIDTLLKTDLKDIPQKPRWADGSGLSRYNLFSPQSFVYLLNKMKNEFGMERLKVILPTGGSGTFKNYFQKDSGCIYAKTGSLSNHIAISGYLLTKKGRWLIFSILTNQFQGSATKVRRAEEKFLEGIRERY